MVTLRSSKVVREARLPQLALRGAVAYRLFYSEQVPHIRAKRSRALMSSKLQKIVAGRWRALSLDERREWERKAVEETGERCSASKEQVAAKRARPGTRKAQLPITGNRRSTLRIRRSIRLRQLLKKRKALERKQNSKKPQSKRPPGSRRAPTSSPARRPPSSVSLPPASTAGPSSIAPPSASTASPSPPSSAPTTGPSSSAAHPSSSTTVPSVAVDPPASSPTSSPLSSGTAIAVGSSNTVNVPAYQSATTYGRNLGGCGYASQPNPLLQRIRYGPVSFGQESLTALLNLPLPDFVYQNGLSVYRAWLGPDVSSSSGYLVGLPVDNRQARELLRTQRRPEFFGGPDSFIAQGPVAAYLNQVPLRTFA